MGVEHITKKVALIGYPEAGKHTYLGRVDELDGMNREMSYKFLDRIGACIGKYVDTEIQREENTYAMSLLIWDITGREKFNRFHGSYLGGAEGILIAANAMDIESVQKIRYWDQEVRSYGRPVAKAVLLTHSNDIEAQQYEDLKDLVNEILGEDVPVFFTDTDSTKDHLEEPLNWIAERLVDEYEDTKGPPISGNEDYKIRFPETETRKKLSFKVLRSGIGRLREKFRGKA